MNKRLKFDDMKKLSALLNANVLHLKSKMVEFLVAANPWIDILRPSLSRDEVKSWLEPL